MESSCNGRVYGCDGGVKLCWWSGVESNAMVEYSFVGRAELSEVEWSCDGRV